MGGEVGRHSAAEANKRRGSWKSAVRSRVRLSVDGTGAESKRRRPSACRGRFRRETRPTSRYNTPAAGPAARDLVSMAMAVERWSVGECWKQW